MTTIRSLAILAVLGPALLAGCGDGGPTDPQLQDLSLEDELSLDLLSDPATTQIALDLADVQASAAHRNGWGHGIGNHHRNQAELRFEEARQALEAGDLIRARERSRAGRNLVSQAMEMAGGPQAVLGMVERLESLPAEIQGDPGAFQSPGPLGLQLGQLAIQAREALRKGDRTRAGGLAVLGEQAFQHRHRHQYQNVGRGADIAVALAREAVALAQRLLAQAPPASDTEHAELLATAEEFLVRAQTALEAGEEGRAVHLAHLATWWALKAVVLPGGISDEDVRSIHDLAFTLLVSAEAAVEADPTELKLDLLARATTLFQRGEEKLTNGVCRGIGALWQSSVISSYLLG